MIYVIKDSIVRLIRTILIMLNLILIKSKKLKKNYLVFLKAILNKYIKKVHVKSNTLYIKTLSGYLYPLALFLKNHTAGQFKTLVDIVAYDKPGNKFRFTLINILLSLEPVKMQLVGEKILNKSDKSPVADGVSKVHSITIFECFYPNKDIFNDPSLRGM